MPKKDPMEFEADVARAARRGDMAMQWGGQWKVTIHPDMTPGGCAGGWMPPS